MPLSSRALLHRERLADDVVIVGGLGHVGLPLGIVFADKNLKVCLYDIDAKKVDMVRKGNMPFIEYGAEPILKKVLHKKHRESHAEPQALRQRRITKHFLLSRLKSNDHK